MSSSIPLDPTLSFPGDFYPYSDKQTYGVVKGVDTTVMISVFTDTVMVTITQDGRLASWIQVPLDVTNPGRAEIFLPTSSDQDSLLPMPQLTASTLLGTSNADRDTINRLYATQIASLIALKRPDENRKILIGMGLRTVDADREVFFDVLELVTQCLSQI